MMQIAAYGRLGQDPREIQTESSSLMAASSLAVTLTDRQGAEHAQWLSIVCFGRVAEILLKHSKGELLSVSGRVQANTYQERVELQVVCRHHRERQERSRIATTMSPRSAATPLAASRCRSNGRRPIR